MNAERVRVPRETLLAGVILLAGAAFGATTAGFFNPADLADRSRAWAEMGLIAVPMTFVIASGGIDLSVGSLLALSAVCAGRLHEMGAPLGIAFAAAVAAGAAGGLFNALAMQALRLSPLIVTFGTMALFRGLAYACARSRPISSWPDSLADWAQGFPWPFAAAVAAFAAGQAVFSRHLLGRRARQLGENPRAARACGLSPARLRYALYGLTGAACGAASICSIIRFATAHPGAAQGLELDVIAVVVLGGTRITGGNGSVLGSFLGLLLFGLLRYGMDLQSVAQQDQSILIGVAVVAVAAANAAFPKASPS